MTYPIQAAIRARQHHAAGWSPSRIRELLGDEGYGTPALSTIKTWVLPNYNVARYQARTRQWKRARDARNASFRLPGCTPEYQAAFMLELRMRGTPCTTIARVCEVVFGARYTADAVRMMLREASSVNEGTTA